MFTTPTPSAPSLTSTTTASPASPSQPGRPSRGLRGLSYLRTYTHHNHNQQQQNNRPEPSSAARSSRLTFSRSRSDHSPLNLTGLYSSSSSAALDAAGTRPADPVIPTSTSPVSDHHPQHHHPDRSPTSPGFSNADTTASGIPTLNHRPALSRDQPHPGTTPTLGSGAAASSPTQETTTSAEPAQPLTTSPISRSAPAHTMARGRAETAAPALGGPLHASPSHAVPANAHLSRSTSANNNNNTAANGDLPSIRLTPHHDPRAQRPSLNFPAITRILPNDSVIIKVGRYSERESHPDVPNNIPSGAPVGFKSKVVSRRHCEFWCHNSQWFIKDVKSSSGTFLNHVRLSPPGQESKPWPVNDGDIVQLGIDFRGGEEMIFRCVKIRIECNRSWQKGPNHFNTSTHKRLQNLSKKKDSDAASINSSECSICLMSIAPCQSLFVAPCSHVWHYKCIRPILNGHTYPNFLCPNCRAFADLEADVDDAAEEWEESVEDAIENSISDPREGDLRDEVTSADILASTVSLGAERAQPAHSAAAPNTATSGAANGRPTSPDDQDAAAQDSERDDLRMLIGMNNLILAQSAETSPPPPSTSTSTTTAPASASASAPIPIPLPTRAAPPRPREATPDRGGVATAVPERGRDNLSPGGVVAEGPMTPRNDVGPFVLDGGAGGR